jgi:hypothetical protein
MVVRPALAKQMANMFNQEMECDGRWNVRCDLRTRSGQVRSPVVWPTTTLSN